VLPGRATPLWTASGATRLATAAAASGCHQQVSWLQSVWLGGSQHARGTASQTVSARKHGVAATGCDRLFGGQRVALPLSSAAS
jgi:hypothetical protein